MMQTEKKSPRVDRKSTWTGLLLVLVAAVTVEATSLIQYFYVQRGIREEASRMASSQIRATQDQILDVIDQAEMAVRNNAWITQWSLSYPDSLKYVSRRIIEENDVVVGSTVAMVPNYYHSRPLFAPYYYSDGDSLCFRSLATSFYNYPAQEWFRVPLEKNEGYWSEPYIDVGGGEMLMTTFSLPIKDKRNRTAAILTADVSLDWLSDLVDSSKIFPHMYPHAINILISREGRIMVSPSQELIMQKTVDELVGMMKDSVTFRAVSQAMQAGESGSKSVYFRGGTCEVYYAPITRTGWSMCILIPHKDIYGQMRKIGWLVRILQLLGLAMLILILRSFVLGQSRLRELNERKKSMESELRVAQGIQMSMVPNVTSATQTRDNLDIAATIVPAKEVGGDLYDYYFRGNKLFFCIGDVSGKGVPAALVMAVTRTVFRAVSAHESDPARIVKAMNDSLTEMNENNMFVTFFCGVLDLGSGHLRYCNAGHNPPMILTDAIRPLPVTPNLPLGILHGMDYVGQEVDLTADDALFLYTDGLTEAENASHEQFGEDRTKKALHGRKSSDAHLSLIRDKVSEFVGDAPQSDDLTMLFRHYLGPIHLGKNASRLMMINDIRQLSRLPGFVEQAVAGTEMDPAAVSNLNLALEEAVANVIEYAYPEGKEGPVELTAFRDAEAVHFILSDRGQPFDPTAAPEADVHAGLTERRIGGLGIHLVRSIMDAVCYERKDGWNILTMTKKI